MDRLWLRGGFPRSFLAASEPRSFTWRRQFIRTFLERDVPQLRIRVPALQLERFWTMLAHYHGQIWNAAEPASSLGLSQPTVRSYLGVMTSVYMIRQLQPWHENLAKRQVKSPKIYLRDAGLLHALLGIRSRAELLSHPKLGASWESFVIEQLLQAFEFDHAYFWATHQGAELDLLLMRGARRIESRKIWWKLDVVRRWESGSAQLDRSIPVSPRHAAKPACRISPRSRAKLDAARRRPQRDEQLSSGAESGTGAKHRVRDSHIHRGGFRDRPDFCAGASPYLSNSNCSACRKSRLCGMSVCSESALSFSAVSTGT